MDAGDKTQMSSASPKPLAEHTWVPQESQTIGMELGRTDDGSSYDIMVWNAFPP